MSGATQASYEPILSAYETGGLALSLIVAGFLIITLGTGLDVGLNAAATVNPNFVLAAGVGVVITGALLRLAQSEQRNRVQLAIVSSLARLIEGASDVATDGANYQVALDKALAEFPKIVQAFAEMLGETER